MVRTGPLDGDSTDYGCSVLNVILGLPFLFGLGEWPIEPSVRGDCVGPYHQFGIPFGDRARDG